MAGISFKAAGKPENKFKISGKEQQHQEFSDGSGLEEYSALFRDLDPQTGRWWQIDPKIEAEMEKWSPYVSNFDNPIRYSDPKGDCPTCKEIWKDIKDAAKETWGSIKTGTNTAYDGAVHFARDVNSVNPIASAVEVLTGRSSQSDFTLAKPRKQAVAELGVNTIMMVCGEFALGLRAETAGAEILLANSAIKGGEWITTKEIMSEAAAKFQSSVTGVPANQSFLLNGVKFDGVAGNILLEAKSGMTNFVNSKTGQFENWFNGSKGLVDQARRQLEAANGANVQWFFEYKSVMQATQTLFKDFGIKGINLVYKAQ